MVDALRAALRLFPSRPSPPTSGGCPRASLVRRHHTGTSDSTLHPFASSSAGTCECPTIPLSGLARLAHAVLTYVGVGISVLAANRLAEDPTVLYAREVERTSYAAMSAEERAYWQQKTCKECLSTEDLKTDSSFPFIEEMKSPFDDGNVELCKLDCDMILDYALHGIDGGKAASAINNGSVTSDASTSVSSSSLTVSNETEQMVGLCRELSAIDSKPPGGRFAWQTAGEKELADFVSNLEEVVENCDLPFPSPLSSSYYKGALASCDLFSTTAQKSPPELLQSFDKGLLDSLICGEEPSFLESRSLPLSNLLLGNLKSSPRVPLPSSLTSPSHGKKSPLSYGDGTNMVCDKSRQALGEALCHSQTRAREAEMAAASAQQDKDQAVRLLFREASRTRAYAHWVRLLEIEKGSCIIEELGSPASADNSALTKLLRQAHQCHPFLSIWQGANLNFLAFSLSLTLVGLGLAVGWCLWG